MKVLRIDDIPLIYEQVKSLGIAGAIDRSITPHGNWQGLSLGRLVSLWICYLLSEADHRLSPVEAWGEENEGLLSVISGEERLVAKDFTDDRLGLALDYLSVPDAWGEINKAVAGSMLEVYDADSLCTLRLDSAPMQGYKDVSSSELFRHGYGKHHNPKLGMVKVMLASVDDAVGGFGVPLAHLTVQGSTADDVLYRPAVEECEAVMGHAGVGCRRLYVGDGKMGSRGNRSYIVSTDNDYLVPLSKVQLPEKERLEALSRHSTERYKKVFRTDANGQRELVAEGFAEEAEVVFKDGEGEPHIWKERRLYVRSLAYAKSQGEALDRRLAEAVALIEDLPKTVRGRRTLQTAEEMRDAIGAVLSAKRVEGLLKVGIKEERHSRKLRKYGGKPVRVEEWSTFSLDVRRNKARIAERKRLQGWQVYATTVPAEKLDFAGVVWKYRRQNRVESRFNDLRNKVVPLLPVFLKKDNRVEALVNLLMLCLKVCAMMEYKAAKKLMEEERELNGIYEGNPKRSTDRPTAKRMLRQFRGISIVVMDEEGGPCRVFLTELGQTQREIIDLLGFGEDIYLKLPHKLQLFFEQSKMGET